MTTWPAASTPCTWKTDFAMSRPIVVIVCMDAPPNRGSLNSAHIFGTHVPVEEPSTASLPDSCSASTQLLYPITSSASCPRRNPALPRAPHRGRESRLAGRHLVRPNDDLFAVLPLDRHRFVSGLVAPLIDGEIAKDRLRLEGEQRSPQLFRIET